MQGTCFPRVISRKPALPLWCLPDDTSFSNTFHLMHARAIECETLCNAMIDRGIWRNIDTETSRLCAHFLLGSCFTIWGEYMGESTHWAIEQMRSPYYFFCFFLFFWSLVWALVQSHVLRGFASLRPAFEPVHTCQGRFAAAHVYIIYIYIVHVSVFNYLSSATCQSMCRQDESVFVAYNSVDMCKWIF